MLTPEFLSIIEFNDVVKIYEQLNIDITVDIIKRVSEYQEITATTKEQLRILKQINGAEIFNETLEKTAMLNAETKKNLKDLFTDVAKEDMKGYKELYQYRNKPFKLSEMQYAILNQGLRNTERTLKNFTNTIAFRSQQAYVDAIDRAYIQAVTGGFSYDKAIDMAIQDLAKKGVTLNDAAGRNVQLEVAVRRNVLSGIRDVANKLERNIEEDLGCDGFEVTAHYGARPTHAEAQGKQYAVNKKDARKYGLALWSDVEDLWEEYNCRHTYFGIILGISEPIYSKSELRNMKNAKVQLNGKEVPYYEATKQQRALENEIRKAKKEIQILEKTEQNTLPAEIKLKELNKKYTQLCDETGFKKDYARINIANDKKKMTSNEKDAIIEKKEKHKIAEGKNLVGKWQVTEQDKIAEDSGLKRILKEQGFDNKPKLVNDKEFEKATKESKFFAQRTYGGKTVEEVKEFQRQLYEDEWYIDCSSGGSQYGKGMYCAATYDIENQSQLKGIVEEMKHYIGLNSNRQRPIAIVEDITLDKSAKFIEYDKIKTNYIKQLVDNNKKENDNFIDKYEELISERADLKVKFMNANYIDKNMNLANEYYKEYNKKDKECEQYFKNMPDDIKNAYKELSGVDPSILAVEMGYDAINAKGHGQSGSYTVILNRTKLIIRKGGTLYE